MKKAADFFIFSNVYISICAAFFCFFNTELLNLQENDANIGSFIFFSTLSAYNFHRLRGLKSSPAQNPRMEWVKKHYLFSISATLVSLAIAIVLYFHLPNSGIILLLPLTLISIWYAVDLIKQGNFDRPLREVPFLKIFLISFVWVGACLMFPAVSHYGFTALSSPEIQMLAFAYGIFVFSLTLPFDIRDLRADRKQAILTIPGSIGIKRTKILSILGFLASSALVVVLYLKGSIDVEHTIAFLLSCILAIVLVAFSSSRKSEYYFSFLMELPLALPFLFLQLFSLF